MTKQEILDMTGLTEDEFYAQYPTEESFQMAMGGMVDEYKKGGWIQKATASIKRRGTEGVCTGSNFGGPSCRPGTKRYALAKTFRKMAKARKKEDGGEVEMYDEMYNEMYDEGEKTNKKTPNILDYKYPSNSKIDWVDNLLVSNEDFGGGKATSSNKSQGFGRIIDMYNDGTPNDTSYMYTDPRQSVFFSTKINPETNKPLSNFEGPDGKVYSNISPDSLNMYKAAILNQLFKKQNGGMVDMYEDGEDPPYTSRDRAQDSTLYADINIPFNMRKILLGDTFGSYEEIGSAEDYGSDPSVEEMIAHMRDPRASGYSHARQAAINAFRNKGAAGKLYLTNDEVAKIAKRFQDVDKEGKYTTPNNPMYGSNSYDLKATLSAPDYWRVMQEIKRNKSKKANGGVVDAYQLMGMPTPSMYGMGGETGGPFEDSVLDMSSMEGMSIGEIKNELKNNSEQAKRNIITYDLNYINNLKDVLTPEEKFNLELAYRRNLKNWNVGATGKVDYNRTINPESKSSVIQRNVNLGITGGYQGPNGSTLSGEINYNPTTKTWGGSAKGSIAFKEGGSIMYGMGGYAPIGMYSHVMSRKNVPNMGMAYGGQVPMYKLGSVLKDIGAGAYGAGEGLLDTVTFGATDQLTDQGYKGLQKLGGSSESEIRQQDSIRGYGMTAGAITGGILNPAAAPAAIQQGSKGLGMGISKGSPDSKLAQGIGTYLPMAGNIVGMAAGQGAFGNIGGGAAGMAQSADFAKSGFGQFAQGAGQMGKGYNAMQSGNPMAMLSMFGGGYAMGGQVNYPEGLQMGDGSYVPMMSRPITDRMLSNRTANRIPTFAMGGSTDNTIDINVEKGELLIDPETGKILTEYRGGGMVPHPEKGIDERGTVSAQEGKFVIPKKYAERYKKADKLGKKSVMQLTVVEKAKKEAKEKQLAMAEEQKAAKAMNRMVAKYGGAIQRMYAQGGMIPKYDPGSWVTNRLNLNNPAFGNVDMSAFTTPTTTFSGSAGFGSTPSSLNLDTSPMTMGQYLTGQSGSYMDPKNIPDTGIGYKGGEYKTPNTGGANYSDLISTGLPYALAASQVVEPLLQKPFSLKASDYQTPADTKWEDMTGESGRRDMLRAYNLAKYNARQIGGSGALAALQAGSTGYQQALAAYNEGLENKNKLGKFEAAKFNKAIQQGNLGLAMQIAQFNEQNKAARRNAIRQGAMNLAGTAYNQQANQMTKEGLSAAYPDYQFSWNKKRG